MSNFFCIFAVNITKEIMNNIDPSAVISNSKRYVYRLGNFTGARLKYEIAEFKKYEKIVIDGFTIHNNYTGYLEFSVDNQLVRRLKLKNINNQIKNCSIEDRVLRLLEISEPYPDEPDNMWSSYYHGYSNYNYNYEYNNDYNKEMIREQKRYQKYQSKQISQMANRYSRKGY